MMLVTEYGRPFFNVGDMISSMAIIDIDKVGFIESNRFLNACQMINVTISRVL